MFVAGTVVGGTPDVAGLARVAVECILLGAALGAVAAVPGALLAAAIAERTPKVA